uniref:Serine/threonine-protein kinase RIO3 n=1 Tax=Panagrellus redivivus TaxID=6233 RepID=A0A7E4UNV8_PANRE
MADGLPSTSVWGRPAASDAAKPAASLADIMSEELVTEIQKVEIADDERERLEILKMLREAGVPEYELDTSNDFQIAVELSVDPDISADEAMARQLQRELDREHELNAKFEASKSTGGVAKAVVGHDSYKYLREEEEERQADSSEDEEDFRELATNMLYQYKKPEFPPCGFRKDPSGNGNIITKHDKEITAAKNCERAMHFPTGVQTGDFVGHNISNRVFNSLRTHVKAESKRQQRLKDKDEQATNEATVDGQTRLILFKWINLTEFDEVDEVIATGKESAVLHARKNVDAEDEAHYAIKVYKMTLDAFKNRAEYVKDDFRFKNPRRVMKVWAEKEFLNLKRIHRAGLRCPIPLHLKKHVLLMTMIGHKEAAIRLKNVVWVDEEQRQKAYAQSKEIICRMYSECNLIHGDFSEFNLLYHDGDVYVIDVAQAMDLSHSRALMFLVRDIENILEFFHRIGTDDLPSSTALFNEVTGLDMDENDNLSVQVEAFETENRGIDRRKDKNCPANVELRAYNEERRNRSKSPAKDFN